MRNLFQRSVLTSSSALLFILFSLCQFDRDIWALILSIRYRWYTTLYYLICGYLFANKFSLFIILEMYPSEEMVCKVNSIANEACKHFAIRDGFILLLIHSVTNEPLLTVKRLLWKWCGSWFHFSTFYCKQ